MRGGCELVAISRNLSSCRQDAEELMAKANDAIEHAKWERWEEMFEIFDLHPGLPDSKKPLKSFNFTNISTHFLENGDFLNGKGSLFGRGGCQNMRPEFRRWAVGCFSFASVLSLRPFIR